MLNGMVISFVLDISFMINLVLINLDSEELFLISVIKEYPRLFKVEEGFEFPLNGHH